MRYSRLNANIGLRYSRLWFLSCDITSCYYIHVLLNWINYISCLIWDVWSKQQVYSPWSHFVVMFCWRMKEVTDLLFSNFRFFSLVQISVKIQVVLTNFGCYRGNEELYINFSLTFIWQVVHACAPPTHQVCSLFLEFLLRAAQKIDSHHFINVI